MSAWKPCEWCATPVETRKRCVKCGHIEGKAKGECGCADCQMFQLTQLGKDIGGLFSR